MTILKLPSYYYPEKIASSHLSNDLEHALTDSGNTLEIYTPMPCRGVSKQTRKEYSKIRDEIIKDGKVHVHRFSLFSEGKNPVLRAIRYVLCNIIQYHKGAKAVGVDLIFAGSTPPTQGFLCAKVKKKLSKKYKKNVPFVYNLQDIFPDSLVNTGMTHKGSLLWKIGRKVESYTYKNADKIIVISEDFKKNIMEKGVPEEKIEIIYNWVDEKAVVSVPREKNKLFDEYNLDKEKFYVAYSGNIGMTQNMDMLLDAAKELEDNSEIGFVLVGEGAYKTAVEKRIKEEKISNVALIPFQEYDRISEVFSIGDVGLLISKAGVGTNSVPSKTWSYMSAERPIIASFDADSELCRIIKANECGLCTQADETKPLIEAIFALKNNPQKCREYGLNGRKIILSQYSADKCTAQYVKVLKEICGKYSTRDFYKQCAN